MERLDELLKATRNCLQQVEHDHCVSVTVFFNSEGYTVERKLRTPGSLKRDGISMCNIKGEFIQNPR